MPPSNAGYYVAAYIAAAAVYGLYALSLAVRTRALRQRMDTARREDAE